MKAILLCGGLGTRLRPVIGEKQKAMADVKGKPFLHVLIDYLKTQDIHEYIFACGYKKEEIEDYFGDGKSFDIKIQYAVEKEPLGTGGAIKNCLSYINEEKIYVLNADTLFKIEYKKLYDNMIENDTDISIVVKNVDDVVSDEKNNRYGNIKVKDNLVESFIEKPISKEKNTYINGGIYLIKKKLIEKIPDGKVSLENEIMQKWIKESIKVGAYIAKGSFIDIGTPDSYKEINN